MLERHSDQQPQLSSPLSILLTASTTASHAIGPPWACSPVSLHSTAGCNCLRIQTGTTQLSPFQIPYPPITSHIQSLFEWLNLGNRTRSNGGLSTVPWQLGDFSGKGEATALFTHMSQICNIRLIRVFTRSHAVSQKPLYSYKLHMHY